MREEQIADQIEINSAWKRHMGIWYALHYGLGVAAIALSVTVASKPFAVEQSSNLYHMLAWLLALFTGFIAFLHPEQRGDRYQRAWSILDNEITRFKTDPT